LVVRLLLYLGTVGQVHLFPFAVCCGRHKCIPYGVEVVASLNIYIP